MDLTLFTCGLEASTAVGGNGRYLLIVRHNERDGDQYTSDGGRYPDREQNYLDRAQSVPSAMRSGTDTE
jgi:hypothetical protein